MTTIRQPSYTLRTPPKHVAHLRDTERTLAEEVIFRHSLQRNILHDFVVQLTDPNFIRRHGWDQIALWAEEKLQEVAGHDQ